MVIVYYRRTVNMGRTKSQSRSSSSSSTRSVPYDMNIPENKTVARLKVELSSRGIEFPSNAKKSQLLRLWKTYIMKTTSGPIPGQITEPAPLRHDTLPEVPPEARDLLVTSQEEASQNSPRDGSKHGDLHPMQTAISSMAATMESLVNRISELEKFSNLHPKTITIPQVSLTIHPYYMAEPLSKHTLETAMMSSQTQRRFSLDNVTGSSVIADNQIDAGNGLSIPQSHGLRTDRGYSSESLPHVELVSPMIRRKIIEGKDINLAVLLIPHYEGAMTNEERSEMYSCSTRKPDHRLNKILDLSSFMKAFGIYKSVMTEVYSQRQKELDLYERNIIDMGMRYPGSGFYEYHKQFSAKAAAYLQQHNIKIDWSIRDNILYTNIFTGQQASSCRLCHSLSHATSFCPQSLHDNRMPTNRYENNQQFKSNDMKGRNKQFFQDQEICNNFNGPKGCYRIRCGYSHVCISCHKAHPQTKCPSNGSVSKTIPESKNEQTPRNRPNK